MSADAADTGPRNVFIRCLPRTMDSDGLFALAASCVAGVRVVSARVIVDPRTGQSLSRAPNAQSPCSPSRRFPPAALCAAFALARVDISLCYGFALLESADEAASVVRALHRRRVGGKTLACKLSRSTVSLERPLTDAPDVSHRLFVRGFPAAFTDGASSVVSVVVLSHAHRTHIKADLRALFEPFGNVLECKVLMRDDGKANKQIGLVRQASRSLARSLLTRC